MRQFTLIIFILFFSCNESKISDKTANNISNLRVDINITDKPKEDFYTKNKSKFIKWEKSK